MYKVEVIADSSGNWCGKVWREWCLLVDGGGGNT